MDLRFEVVVCLRKRIGLLGCGGFGTVELWEHVKTQQTFALKAISKGYVVKTGMQERFSALASIPRTHLTPIFEGTSHIIHPNVF